MIKQVVEAIFGSRQAREVKKLQPVLEAIHSHEAQLATLDEETLQAQTAKFRAIIAERTDALKAEVDRIRAAKHGCADPVERDGLEGELVTAENAWKEAIAATLDDLLPEAFATVREACRRLMGTSVEVTGQSIEWNMVPYDVQLIGGINLHRGRIAEMATGEGKTLVATLPLYLNALTGRGAQLVTVNNYLARRDSQWMGHLYRYLGLSVACLDDTQPSSAERQAAYRADITYGTNNEFGFDYLRDNMVFGLEQRVQREHVYAIIDEVDSILIDEARTPLIISGPVGDEDSTVYRANNARVAELVRRQTEVVNTLLSEAEKLLASEESSRDAGVKLYQARLGMPKNKKLGKMVNESGVQQLVHRAELDAIADRKLPIRQQSMRDVEESLFYVLDEKGHSVHLTDRGATALSPGDPTLFLVPDISQEIHAIDSDPDLEPAEKLERRNAVEAAYATKSEQLHIIHKLLQAHSLYEREVEYIVQEGQVLIVDEFTGRIMHGRRWSDGLHQAVEAKEGVTVKGETQTFATVTIQNYFRMYEKLAGMTGTAETEETEFYSIYGLEVSVIPTNRPIARRDLPDRIYRTRREKYNAVADEVERIHQQGWPILIGTTSVDVSETLSRQLKRRGLPHEVLNAKYHQREAEIVAKAGQKGGITIATNMAGRGTDIKLDPALDLTDPAAGLYIVGTERHESRRIDRQLRGRSGRQGDPGESLFFLSLEDDLMRLFGGMDRIAKMMDKSGAEEGEVITGRLITAAIEGAQKRVEMQNFQQRKRALEYDDVLNQQRDVIYSTRLFALERGEELKAEALKMITAGVERHVTEQLGAAAPEQWDRALLKEGLMMQFLIAVDAVEDPALTPDLDRMLEVTREEATATFHRKLDYLTDFGARIGIPDVPLQVLSQVTLGVLDEKWKDHLYDLDQLRNAIHYRAYGQKDPLIEYKKEAFEMFEDLLRDIQATFADRFLKVQVNVNAPPPPPPPPTRAVPPVAPSEPSTDDLFRGGAPSRLPSPSVAATGPSGAAFGAAALPAADTAVGRNDPCPCGSGKKYKKCHGASA
ncbi:MAG: preprotein translocase subunit SecA [Gemmatimonadales bacterium]|nr:preprotein translocase subunit SecA [Gemmatimonadales bacterium]MDZ4389845.1 preprotein translocase subunit SecA [Gemmatimonadales bacterium]